MEHCCSGSCHFCYCGGTATTTAAIYPIPMFIAGIAVAPAARATPATSVPGKVHCASSVVAIKVNVFKATGMSLVVD